MVFAATAPPPNIQSPFAHPSYMCCQSLASSPISVSFPAPNSRSTRLRLHLLRAAAKQQTGQIKKHSPPSGDNKKKKNKSRGGNSKTKRFIDVEIMNEFDVVEHSKVIRVDDEDEDDGNWPSTSDSSLAYQPDSLPKPPAGFVLDNDGNVVMVSNKILATIIDPENNRPLECVIRRVVRNGKGDEYLLLYPADMPVMILKSMNVEGWTSVEDDVLERILPAAAYALAKVHMHLVHSGFCYTARGGFMYMEEDVFDVRTDGGEDTDGLPGQGVEITCFHVDGEHYMIYTPTDPVLFVALKDCNGNLQIAGDEHLEDPAVLNAIDEESEFNAMVEEEEALLDSMLGKR